ncbi:MAG TPA: DUF6518 family protein [Longimicrobium sp.]|nr:DUF6518 family protein [Longimicrobium sp.]
MKIQFDPPVPAPGSLPLAIVVGMALSAILMPLVQLILLPIFRIPLPPLPVWVDYLAVRAVAGACVGVVMYASGRLSHGWLRMCLGWTAFVLLVLAYVDDFARMPLHRFLSVWVVSGLIIGVTFGTVFHALERRNRRRTVAGQ